MKLRAKHLLLGATTGWMLATTASAFVAPYYTTSTKADLAFMIKQRVLRPETFHDKTAAGNKGAEQLVVRRDTISGSIRVLAGQFGLARLDARTGSAAFVQAALSYIDHNHDTFGLTSQDVKVAEGATYLGTDEQFLKFHVYRDGVRIADAGIDFRFKRGQLVQVINQSFAEAASPAASAVPADLDSKVADLTFASSVQAQGPLYRVEADVDAKTYRLVRVESYKVTSELGDLTAEIDPATTKLFEVRDNHYHFGIEVKGDIYPRWYNETLSLENLENIAVQTDDGDVYPSRRNKKLANPRLDGLNGRYVTIENQSGTAISQSAELVDGNWQIHVKKEGNQSAWLDKSIAQLMVYAHTNAINQKAKEYITHNWLDKPLQANTNLPRSCNAHWDGSTINMYSGSAQCANTGLIADVIYHEWGHGLDAKTGGIDDGAFSEGFGDILALLMTRSPLLGIGFKVANHAPVRDLEPDRVYPDDRGEVHAEGLIIASTFWDLFKALSEKYDEDKAADIIAQYAFKMIFTARSYLDVYEAIKVIDDNDTDLGNGTPNLCVINDVFAQHGLAERDESCKLAGIDSYKVEDDDGDAVIEPGESVALFATARNVSSRALSGLGGRLSISAGEGVDVTDAALSWDTIPAQDSLLSQNGAQLAIASDAVCGSTFTTKLVLQANGADATIFKTFTIGRNNGSSEDFAASGLPIPIEDRTTVRSSVEVGGEQWGEETPVASAHLKFEIRHSYVGDLVISLVSPSGESFEVFRGRGTGNDVSYDADVSALLAGKAGTGTWTLAVQDKARRDSGYLDSFQLSLTPAVYVCD